MLTTKILLLGTREADAASCLGSLCPKGASGRGSTLVTAQELLPQGLSKALCHEPPPATRAPALLLPLHLAPFPRLAGSFAFITSEYLILAARAHRLYMLSLDKAQISLLSAVRPRQPFPASPERCQAAGCCRYHPPAAALRDAAPRLSEAVSTPLAQLSSFGTSDVGRERVDGCAQTFGQGRGCRVAQ